MVISRSSIPQQISKPGVKKMNKGRKTRRNTTSATKDIKKSLSKAKERLKKDTGNFINKYGKDIAEIAVYATPVTGFAYELLKPKKAGTATLDMFTKEELKEMRRKVEENEKYIKKYMGGSLNKRKK